MFGVLKIYNDNKKELRKIKFAKRYYADAYCKYQNTVAKANERTYHFEVFNYEDYKNKETEKAV